MFENWERSTHKMRHSQEGLTAQAAQKAGQTGQGAEAASTTTKSACAAKQSADAGEQTEDGVQEDGHGGGQACRAAAGGVGRVQEVADLRRRSGTTLAVGHA